MRPAKLMDRLVHDLLAQYWPGESGRRILLELAMDGHRHLIVEEFVCRRLFRVGYYLQSPNGRRLPDPAMIFGLDNDAEWIPIEITRVLGGQWIVGGLAPQTGELSVAEHRGQAELAAYADLWAYNLRLQGWVERAQRLSIAAEQNATGGDRNSAKVPPDIETLQQWLARGGCEATDGCWVEPDGTCPHGYRSWLLELGLI